MKTISIIIPTYNESENINNIYKNLLDNINMKKYDYEIIFINDWSFDNSQEIIEKLCSKDNNVKSIILSRNFGQQNAILAWYHNARWDIIVSLDCDMQDNPSLLNKMLWKIEEWYDIVYTKRNIQKWWEILTNIFYKLLKITTRDIKIEEFVWEYRMFNRKVLLELNKLTEKNIYLPWIFAYLWFKNITIDFNRWNREKWISSYNIWRLYTYATNWFIWYSNLLVYVWYLLWILSFVLMIITLFLSQSVNTLIIIWLLWIIFIYIAFVIEYLIRINIEIKNRPSYIIYHKINFK